jgi:hypothetical protein
MMTTATHNEHGTTPERVLFMAFELSENTWKLGFTTGPGHKPLRSLSKLPEQLDVLRLWDGSPIPSGLRRRLLRMYQGLRRSGEIE